MMWGRRVLLLLLCAGTCHAFEPEPIVFAHRDEIIRGSGYAVAADRRVFAVTALLNATGYDAEAEGKEMHPVRVVVRRMLDRHLVGKESQRREWSDQVQELNLPIFVYLDFALSLSTDHPFRRVRPDDELGYPAIAKRLAGLPDVLNEFWKVAKLEQIWNAIKPDYRAELERYDFADMSAQMSGLWHYLRLERQDTHTIVNVPALLVQHYQAIGALYENYYYTVESPGAGNYSLNLHEYMHSIVNPLVEAHVGSKPGALRSYLEAGRDGPLSESYGSLASFTAECVVRALDYRLRLNRSGDDDAAASLRQRVAEMTDQGLTLIEPVFDLLGSYEESEKTFDRWLPAALSGLSSHGSD